MKNFKDAWAKKAQAKSITASNMIELCILKAMNAKSENKEELTKIFLKKAFSPYKNPTPISWVNYRTVKLAAAGQLNLFKWNRKSMFSFDILENEEESDLFYSLLVIACDKETYNGKD